MSRVLIIDRCWDCPSCHAVCDWPGKCERMDRSVGKPKETIPDWCPLPKPHGPLVDVVLDPESPLDEFSYMAGWNDFYYMITGGRDEKTRNDKEPEGLRG